MGAGTVDHLPSDISADELLRRLASEEERASYDNELNAYFADLLADYNNRDVEQINAHLDTIVGAIGIYVDGTIRLVYGGSIKKHTYVDGLSDVDVLAILNGTSLATESPEDVLDYFASRLQERLPLTEITKGNLAVTITFSDGHQIQVLPAISTKTGVRIASPDGTTWSAVVRPDSFARKLTEVNQSNSGKVVRIVKLFKAVNDQLPKDSRLSGYHIESLAVNAFEKYQGKSTYKDMLMHLSEYASVSVLDPVKDSTGQSLHVDDYLGDAGSLRRRKVSAALGRIASRMRVADSEASVERWRDLMGD